VAHARLVDEMRAVRLGNGVERTGFDYGREIDFGGEGAFRSLARSAPVRNKSDQ
jgi:hypothetical protein